MDSIQTSSVKRTGPRIFGRNTKKKVNNVTTQLEQFTMSEKTSPQMNSSIKQASSTRRNNIGIQAKQSHGNTEEQPSAHPFNFRQEMDALIMV